jgi:hypothetical protein
MKKCMLVLVSLCAAVCQADGWSPDEQFLRAVSFVESSGGRFVWGDSGRSLGEFQIGRAAWSDVNAWRKARGLTTYEYRRHVLDPQINRTYAAGHLLILHQNLKRTLRREPTPGEIYASYNMGLTKFGQECGYDLRRVNKVTAAKCRRIVALLRSNR